MKVVNVAFGLIFFGLLMTSYTSCTDDAHSQRFEVPENPHRSLEKAFHVYSTRINSMMKRIRQLPFSSYVWSANSFGFSKILKSSMTQTFINLNASKYTDFNNLALESLQMDSIKVQRTIQNHIFDVIPKAKAGEWILYRMIYHQKDDSKCYYVSFLVRNNFGKSFDCFLFITSFTMVEQSSSDLIAFRETKSSLWGLETGSTSHIVALPFLWYEQEIDRLFEYLDILAFMKYSSMLNEDMPQTLENRKKRSTEILPGEEAGSDNSGEEVASDNNKAISNIEAVKAGFSVWDTITGAFQTKFETRIVKNIVGEGYSYFFMNSVAHRIQRMRSTFLPRYLEIAARMYNIPQKYRSNFNDAMMIASFSGPQQWNKHDLLFNMNEETSNNVWITILSNQDKDGYFNFLIVRVEQNFVLAPNVLMIRNSQSILGGIYQEVSTQFENVPKKFTKKECDKLFSFFTVVAFKRFAECVGVEAPPDPIINQTEVIEVN